MYIHNLSFFFTDLHSLLNDEKEFNKLYDSLPPNDMDLSSRWTDWDRQTLLYRSVYM